MRLTGRIVGKTTSFLGAKPEERLRRLDLPRKTGTIEPVRKIVKEFAA